MRKLALRIDDIGASTKQFNYYSKNRFCNFGILRHRKLFGAWAPYNEMTPITWRELFELLHEFDAKLTVAITATWVEKNGDLKPFHLKFPVQAEILKSGVKKGFIEIANHGLTHCVTAEKSYKPKIFGSVRRYHREFWDWIDDEVHFNHLQDSQNILQDFFEEKIHILVPPGNVYADQTIKAASNLGINLINCQTENKIISGVKVLGNENVLDFHDREIVLHGIKWLREKLLEYTTGQEFCFVSEL